MGISKKKAIFFGIALTICISLVALCFFVFCLPEDNAGNQNDVTSDYKGNNGNPGSEPSWTLKQQKQSEWEHLFDGENLEEKIKEGIRQYPSPPSNDSAHEFANISLRETLFTSATSRRLLATENMLSNPGIIGFDRQTTSSHDYYAYQYIFTNLALYSSFMVLYPYPFTFTPNASEPTVTESFTNGGVFSIRPDLLPSNPASYNYFSSLLTSTNVTFGKAKALYDINIGVLSISGFYDDVLKDLTYESSSYCNILSSYMGKYKDCLTGSSYMEFKADIRNLGKTALVMLNETDIGKTNLLFTPDGDIRFQLLIIPDYYLGAHDLIVKTLTATGVSKIKDFVQKGGMIFASGKGGFLLERMGVLPTGLYSQDTLLTSTDANQMVALNGCDDPNADFTTAVLCLNIRGSNSKINSYLLSAYLMNKDKASGMTTYLSYDSTLPSLKKSTTDGVQSLLSDTDKNFLPFALGTTYGKGKIYLLNGNPLYKGNYNKVFYNYLFLAMSKNVMIDCYVGSKDGKPIPGGEVGVQLDVKLTFINLYNVKASNVNLHVWLPNNINANVVPADCLPDTTTIPQVNLTYLNASNHFKCSRASVDAFERFEVLFNVEILDFLVTQQKYDILIVGPAVSYTDDETSITYTYDLGGIKTDAALAAYLAGGLEVDPSAFYPLHGVGDYVDNVFSVENKEDTPGIDVDYVAMIPLISPVVDGSEQRAVSRVARFYDSYYNNRDPIYYFPFQNLATKNYDILDVKFLNGKGITMSADWDTPAKSGKMIRDSTFPTVDGVSNTIDIININWSIMIDSINYVLKEIYYIDSDRFFEHATQRLLAFIDTASVNGAKAKYPSGIPAYELNPNTGNTAKKELIWGRVDVFFYETNEFVRPTNVNYTHVLSIDRYPAGTDPCTESFGTARAQKMVQGYFGNSFAGGLKENEYSNEILSYCDKKKVGLAEVEGISNNTIKPIHYCIPVFDTNIKRADDIMDFTVNADGSGYLTAYPELRFEYGHRLQVGIPPVLGGKIMIELPVGKRFKDEDTIDPAKAGLITYSSGLAFFKTEYYKSNGTIVCYFRLGGHVSNATQPSAVDIMLESLTTTEDFNAIARVYEMKFDISLPNVTKYEKYTYREAQGVLIWRDRLFCMPGVEVHNKLLRRNDTRIFPYESIGPYNRLGIYIQELMKHRTVYGFAESHHVKDPGVQSLNAGFSMLSNLGTCAVPFASLVTHGSGLLIPNAPSTARIEWDDIWGRRWISPLRSLYPDIPPVPCPLIRFKMTTTFEATKTNSIERAMSWNSDEELDIHVQIKLHNPYPKYFLITTCKDNEVAYIQERPICSERNRIFEIPDPTYPYQIKWQDAPGDNYQINFGWRSVYGFCFDSPGTILKGILVSAPDLARISTAYLCANTLDENKLLECAQQLADLPTVTKRIGDGSNTWMYTPEVDSYYPKNYIKANMWDMTHKHYDDNPMDKAFKFNLDNNLPGVEFGPSWNPSYIKPHNIIAFPVWKGFGFQMWYDKNKGVKRYPQYKGWWSDNLQNKDHTLFAGQATSNDISVDKPTLLDDSKWINARDLLNPLNPTNAKDRLKTIHCCLFNQHRVRLRVNQTIGAYINNVYQNNIIPILTDLKNSDERYYNYKCDGVNQYSPYNISQLDTIVRTNDIRDSMLFAANLRGGAFETLNIIMGLKPLPNVKYEGLAKVQDGGAFTYWQPANGPNSFESCGSVLNVVEAIRSDLTIDCEIFPKTVKTFNSVLYHMLTIKDPPEILREWKYLTYTNNFGFGDSATQVYVGGAQATKCVLNPGDYTLIKVTFFNNAGFDWNLLYGAVEAVEIGEKALNANDLLSRAKRTIQKPLKYNFMELVIPPEIKDYVTIIPSDHNLDVAPMFFDFLEINVATIKDGGTVSFWYKLTLASTIPVSIRGKVWTIGINLIHTFFDAVPGYQDPTVKGFHDYMLKIPPIKIGIPYADGPYKGKIFYTSGYSSDLVIKSTIPNYWNASEARIIKDESMMELRTASGDPDNYDALLNTLWDKLDRDQVIIKNTSSGSNSIIELNFSNSFPVFPKPNGVEPDIASFNVLLKAKTAQLSAGTVKVISNPMIYFKDFTSKIKNGTVPAPADKTVTVKGAWISVSYSSTIIIYNSTTKAFENAPDQRLFQNDNTFYVKAKLTAKNSGTDTAYRVNFTAVLSDGVNVVSDQIRKDLEYTVSVVDGLQVLKLTTMISFAPGMSQSEYIILTFAKTARRRLLASSSLTFIRSVSANIDLTAAVGANQVSQAISTPLSYSLITNDRETVTLIGTVDNPSTTPLVHLLATPVPAKTQSGQNVRYLFYMKVPTWICESTCTGYGSAEVIIRTLSNVGTTDYSPIPSGFTGTLSAAMFTFRVETYDEKKLLLANSSWTFNFGRPGAPNNNNNNNNNSNNNNNNNNNNVIVNPEEKKNESEPIQPNNTNGTDIIVVNKVEAENVLPLWAIILIPVAAVTIILFAAIVVIKKMRARNKVHNTSSVEIISPQ